MIYHITREIPISLLKNKQFPFPKDESLSFDMKMSSCFITSHFNQDYCAQLAPYHAVLDMKGSKQVTIILSKLKPKTNDD